MQSGLIYLMTDSGETIADISAGLGVVEISYSVFRWGEVAELVDACAPITPAFILCDLADKGGFVTREFEKLLDLLAGQFSGIPLVGLGDLSRVEKEHRDAFAGSIPLPLQFPASAQLLQRLVNECQLRAEQV